jgi:hypothetical protein
VHANERGDSCAAKSCADRCKIRLPHNDAALYEATGGDHGLEQLIYGLDHSAYVVQFTPGIDGFLAGAGDAGGYLVLDDFLGYLGTELDTFLLTRLGLDPGLLGPLIDTIAGSLTF